MREVTAFLRFCESVESPLSQKAQALVRSKDWLGLVNLTVDVGDYDNPFAFHLDYVIKSWLSKATFLPTGIDLKGKALSSFAEAEANCSVTNTLFRMRASGTYSFRPDVELVLKRARQKIAHVLSGWTLPKLFADCRFGPGATFLLKGNEATEENKVLSTDVTPSAYAYARHLIEQDPQRFVALTGFEVGGPFSVLASLFRFVEGSRVTTVPKSAKTDRTIAIEPCLNLELQLGIGAFIRKRLLARTGIDLNDQSHNQRGAALAFDWGFATLDLSAASDSISREIVFDLFPIDFCFVIDAVRSRAFSIDGGPFTPYAKFSSMGNGFTFELESLLFWAISSSVQEDGWSLVYGDDIIVLSECYPLLVEVLEAVGFKVNTEKSYASGNFYESCGEHFFKGVNVTPIYQKESCNSLEADIRMANRILRLAFRMGDGVGCLRILRQSWLCARPVKPSVVMPLVDTSGRLYEGDAGFALPGEELDEFLIKYNGRTPVLSFKTPYSVCMNEQSLYAYSLRFGETRFSAARKGKCCIVNRQSRKRTYVVRRRRFLFGYGNVPWI